MKKTEVYRLIFIISLLCTGTAFALLSNAPPREKKTVIVPSDTTASVEDASPPIPRALLPAEASSEIEEPETEDLPASAENSLTGEGTQSPRPNAPRVQAGILPPISSGSLPAAPKNAEDPDREGHRPESHLPSDTAKIIPAKDTPESGQRPRTGSISGSTPQDPSSPGRTAPESELLGQRPPVQTPESTPKQTPEKTPPSQTLPEPTLPVPETSSPETVPETEEDYRLYSHDFLILDQRLNTEGELSFPAGSPVALPEQSLIGLKRSGENDGKLHAITWRGAHLSAVTEGKAGIYTLLAATQEEMVINTSPYNPLTFVVTIRIE